MLTRSLNNESRVAPAFAGLSLDHPLIMGVVNVTPDSFSDGGETLAPDAAIARASDMIEAGADILDVGGESTRPGAEPVSAAEQISRIVPVIAALAEKGYTVSADTRNAAVMTAALEAGAAIVNDVSALMNDERSLDVLAGSQASVILMHMKGDPQTMQEAPRYENVTQEVYEFLSRRIESAVSRGIARERIAVDPGIGFGKTVEHNVRLLSQIELLLGLECPVVIGISRKSFIAHLSRGEEPKQRLAGSLAAGLAAVARGAHILRVHDVAETAQALKVWRAIDG